MSKHLICTKGAHFAWVDRSEVEQMDLSKVDDPFHHIPNIVMYVRRRDGSVRVLWCSAVYTGRDSEESLAKIYPALCHKLMEKVGEELAKKHGFTIIRIARFTKAGMEYKVSNLYDAINTTMLSEHARFTNHNFFSIKKNELRMNIRLSQSVSIYASSDPEDSSLKIRNKAPTPRGLVFGEFIFNKWFVYFVVRSTAFRITDVMTPEVLKEKLLWQIQKHFGFMSSSPNFTINFKIYPVVRFSEGDEELVDPVAKE